MVRKAAGAPTHSLPVDIIFTVQAWKENDTYVAYVPELDVSSCGDTLSQAKGRLGEAVRLFLEEASELGTLQDILSEAGFQKSGHSWRARKLLTKERVRLALALTP